MSDHAHDACCARDAHHDHAAGATRAWRVEGLDCAEEVATLRRALAPLVPPDHLGFDVLAGRMEVPVDVPASAVEAAVAATGMRATPWQDDAPARDGWETRDVLVAVSGVALVAGQVIHAATGGVGAALAGHDAPLAARAVWLVAIAAGLWLTAPRAWYAARTLRPDMHLLMTLAVAGALVLDEWQEAATVSFLFALSLGLEAWSVARARRAIGALLDLAPPTVRVLHGDHEHATPPDAVPAGTRFLVRPGERVGLDGVIARGTGEVDESPITGESVPAVKGPGDAVFAGTINGTGALEVVSSAASHDSTLARVVRLVTGTRAKRAEVERWVDRFAAIYTPVVLGAAAAVAVIPPLLGAPWAAWLYRGLILLVIGCPCALVLATPVAVVAALASAARRGVLVKGGAAVELPARLAAVALDKTGTLTRGRPAVVEVVPLAEHDETELLARAAALEARSSHPVAAAIVEHARRAGVRPEPAEGVVDTPGRGSEGTFDGRPFWVGSHRWLEERGQETPDLHARIDVMAAQGRTIVVVGNQTHVCGLIALEDEVRPGAAEAIAALRRAGVGEIVMLTGDNEVTADRVARAVGVDQVRAGLLPDEKVAAVDALVARYGVVAMVGDGINDAPAMARASVGIAMGAAGSDVALETADVALMGDDLGRIVWLVEHARATMGIIRSNTAIALGLKAAFAVLALAGWTSLWAAIAADTGASLLVVANALRLLRR